MGAPLPGNLKPARENYFANLAVLGFYPLFRQHYDIENLDSSATGALDHPNVLVLWALQRADERFG